MKRGQITMFIIVGIVVLLIIGLAAVAWRAINKERPPQQLIEKDTPTELKPLEAVIESCLDSATRSSLQDIAFHAGYANPRAAGYLPIPGMPTVSRSYEPFTGLTLPYWSYMASSNTCASCAFATEQPPLDGERFPAIQAQAAGAIEQKLLTCLDNFAGLEKQYTITPTGVPSVRLDFRGEDTIVYLHYPLSIETEALSKNTMEEFAIRVDIPFRSLYETAEKVRTMAERTHFFEGLALETITIESIGDPAPIPPPYGDTDITYDPGPFWTLQQTKALVQRGLQRDIGLVQLFGSKDMSIIDTDNNDLDNALANYYLVIDQPDPSIQARFTYLASWDSYLKISPGGQLIRPDIMGSGVSFIPPVKRSDFLYDLSFPVLVQLEAVTSKGPFTFQFPIEVNVRNNKPVDHEPLEVMQQLLSFCDPRFADGTTATFTVTDTQGQPVQAAVDFTCVSNSCPLGQTKADGTLTAQLPQCLGGQAYAAKQGYAEATADVESDTGETAVALELQKLSPLSLQTTIRYLQKQPYDDNGQTRNRWVLGANTADLLPNQKLTVVLTPKGNPTLAQAVSWPLEAGDDATIMVYPTDYTVIAVMTEDMPGPKTLAGKEICYDSEPLNPLGGEECVDVPPVTFGSQTLTDPDTGEQFETGSTMYVGGLTWDETTHGFTLSQDMIDSGVMSIPIIGIDLSQLQDVDDLNVFDAVPRFSAQLGN